MQVSILAFSCLRTDANSIEQFDVVLVIGEKPKIVVVVLVVAAVESVLDRVGAGV